VVIDIFNLYLCNILREDGAKFAPLIWRKCALRNDCEAYKRRIEEEREKEKKLIPILQPPQLAWLPAD
jgi:hypothetical protein